MRAAPEVRNLLPPIANGVDVDEFSRRRHDVLMRLFSPAFVRRRAFTLRLIRQKAELDLIIAGEIFPYPIHQRYFAEHVQPLVNARRVFVGPVGFAEAEAVALGALPAGPRSSRRPVLRRNGGARLRNTGRCFQTRCATRDRRGPGDRFSSRHGDQIAIRRQCEFAERGRLRPALHPRRFNATCMAREYIDVYVEAHRGSISPATNAPRRVMPV